MNTLNEKYYFEKIKKDLKNHQYETFLIAILSGKEKQQEIEKYFKQKLGRLIESLLNKKADFNNPDILIKINPKTKKINYLIKPLYIFGRYLKIKPGIPQTRWHKKRYQTSVQEEIGNIILEKSQGEDHSFHGCGREDVDVKMLGDGRPFIIEIKNPKKRILDLKKIEKEINQKSIWVKVNSLTFTTKEKIKEIKTSSPAKIYQAEIQLEKEVDKNTLKDLEKKFKNITINQKTPTRVLRRRLDKIRKKKIFYLKLLKYHPITPIFEIKAESGTYIKELVNGDKKRTTPSVSEILNQNCFVKNLEVVKIE